MRHFTLPVISVLGALSIICFFAARALAGDPPVPVEDPMVQLAALKAAYATLKANQDPSLAIFLWAGALSIVLKLSLSLFMNLLYKETKPWTRWVALGAAVPIALLSHFALGNGLFASIAYAGAGPGAIVVHELAAYLAKPKVTKGTLAAMLIGIALVAGAGCNHDQRSKTIHATLVAADTAHAGFVAWDRQHQLDIVATSLSREDGQAKLAAYRLKRFEVEKSMSGVYRSISVASLLNDDQSLTAMLASYSQIVKAIQELTGVKIQ